MFTASRTAHRTVAARVRYAIRLGIALAVLLPLTIDAQSESEWAALRQALVREIESDAARTAFETGRPAFSKKVMDVMGRVPRHRFVLPGTGRAAYDNRPLGIGHGQTISQPYIVALMTDLLEPQPGHVVLEVGTGSGYQAAVLAELVKKVYSVEIVKPLAESAAKRLSDLGYRNITTRESDGYYGWKEHAPFDGIMVTAAASSIPPPLIEQLKPGGRLVIPVGGAFFTQYLMLVTKSADGAITTEQVLPVRFVPLTGGH
jgi:protein-L-isoaspartate(D-aspartate) O-methyltransferase